MADSYSTKFDLVELEKMLIQPSTEIIRCDPLLHAPDVEIYTALIPLDELSFLSLQAEAYTGWNPLRYLQEHHAKGLSGSYRHVDDEPTAFPPLEGDQIPRGKKGFDLVKRVYKDKQQDRIVLSPTLLENYLKETEISLLETRKNGEKRIAYFVYIPFGREGEIWINASRPLRGWRRLNSDIVEAEFVLESASHVVLPSNAFEIMRGSYNRQKL